MISHGHVVAESKMPASPEPPAIQKMAATVAILKMSSVQRNPRTGSASKLSSFASVSADRTSEAGKRLTMARQEKAMATSCALDRSRHRRWAPRLPIGGLLATSPGKEDDRDPEQIDHASTDPHHQAGKLLIHLEIDAENAGHIVVVGIKAGRRHRDEYADQTGGQAVQKE